MIWTPSGMVLSAVLMCSSGFSGASYGAEMPVNSGGGQMCRVSERRPSTRFTQVRNPGAASGGAGGRIVGTHP